MSALKILNSHLVRSFCTSTARDQMVKAPIQVFGLEGRYASALYSAASKQKQLELVEKDLDKILVSFNSDKVFREFLLNPVLQKTLKIAGIQQVASKLSLSSSSTNLLSVLAENGRLKLLPSVTNAFKTLTAATRGDLNVEITCAKELDSATKQELESTLKKFAKKGENLILKYKIDPAIMGGLVVAIGDKYVDLSVANKMKKYTDILKSAV